jgi:hypothetical protein
MTKPMTFDGETLREMNDAELAQHEIDKAADKAETKARADRATARQVVLDRLGITANEAALLLG